MKKKKTSERADPKSALSFKAIRNEYADMGVENYYRNHADVYENPHFQYIKELLEKNQSRIDYSYVLDLACGGGEVSLILRGLGFQNFLGCDPFTFALYEKNIDQKCLKFSFEDIVKGQLSTQLMSNQRFSSIISSFAMHLCLEKQLFPLITQLLAWTNNIVVITPHKRPELEKLTNICLLFEDFVLTERGKKVFLKSYIQKEN